MIVGPKPAFYKPGPAKYIRPKLVRLGYRGVHRAQIPQSTSNPPSNRGFEIPAARYTPALAEGLGVSALDVGIVMGSHSDWSTMQAASAMLDELRIAHESRVISAHRTPHALVDWVEDASKRGCKVFIAGAGMAAALPGCVAALTHLPVLGVPLDGSPLQGLDALLAIVQMPKGVPVGTLAVGKHGATNAAILAASILALSNDSIRQRLVAYRAAQSQKVLDHPDPTEPPSS